MITHWGWVTHICVSKLTIIGSDKRLSSGRRQAIIWTIVGIFKGALRSQLQWNINRNPNIFIQGIVFESGVYEMAAILSQPLSDNNLVCCVAEPVLKSFMKLKHRNLRSRAYSELILIDLGMESSIYMFHIMVPVRCTYVQHRKCLGS